MSYLQRPRLVDSCCILLLTVLSLVIGLPRYRHGIDLGDEGCLAYGAVRVLAGELPNRDFVSLQPPLSFYTSALMFKMFGTTLASLRLLGLGLSILVPLLVYGISRGAAGAATSLGVSMLAAVVGLPYIHFVPFAVWQGVTATLAAAWFLRRALDRDPGGGPDPSRSGRRQASALVAGLVMGASLLLRHDQAVYFILSVLAYVLILTFARGTWSFRAMPMRTLGMCVIGMAVFLLPFGIYWLTQGALPEMFKQLVVFPVTTYASTSSLPFPVFGSGKSLEQNAIVLLFYLPPIIDAAAGIWLLGRLLRRTFGSREAIIAFFSIWAALFYLQVMTRSDLQHLVVTLPPFFILSAGLWSALREKIGEKVEASGQGRSRARVVEASASVLVGAAVVCFLWSTRTVFLPDPAEIGQALVPDRGGVRVKGGETLTALVHAVQERTTADRSILCLPYEPMLYFLCNRRNPTRWNYIWPGDQTPRDHELLIQQAKRDPPAAVLITSETAMGQYAPSIVDYVHAQYKMATEVNTLRVYLPLQ